jgi:succinate dehydrogenase/fumarate reductase flavoprotein subunit
MLYDVIVVGSGIAGLSAALNAKKEGLKVAVVTKSSLLRSNSAVASGGINATLYTNNGDSPELHAQDTIKASKKLAKNKMVKKMCKDAPNIIKEFIEMGVKFDMTDDNKISQRTFGGNSKKRDRFIVCVSPKNPTTDISRPLHSLCKP